MPKQMAVYIMTNDRHRTLYTGVTSDSPRRVWEHREGVVAGFAKRYQVKKLVYYEFLDSPRAAIEREKQIKGGSRAKKEALIGSMNPRWDDLSETLA